MYTKKLHTKSIILPRFLGVMIFFLLSFTFLSQAQVEVYETGDGIIFGTGDSRFSATIIETDAGITVQAFLLGAVVTDALGFSFFTDPNELVWSDKDFIETLPYYVPNEIFPYDIFNDNVKLSGDLLRSGGLGLDFVIAPNQSRYRKAGLALAPDYGRWSDIPGMDVLNLYINDMSSKLEIAAGDIQPVFTCHFKKVHPGRALQASDIGIGVKTYFWGGLYCPKWCYSGYAVTYDDANVVSQYIKPDLFSYRTPSSVTSSFSSEDIGVTAISATLSGNFKRGTLSPVQNLLSGRQSKSQGAPIRNTGLLTWDKVLRSGFIYTGDLSVTTLSIKEYSDVLLVNDEPYPFPLLDALIPGEPFEFTVGDYTFYIVMSDNSDEAGSVDYTTELTGLHPGTPYNAWPCIGYVYETSREYFKLGSLLSEFSTSPDCFAPAAPVTTSQSFCDAAKVSDLRATVAEGSLLEWYDSATGTTPLDANDALSDGAYYARATVTVVNKCYSEPVAINVLVGVGLSSPVASSPQQFCLGTVSDLRATGIIIEWYSTPAGGTPLSSGTALKTGIYYASQRDESGCRSSERTPVSVKVEDFMPSAPSIASPQAFCNEFTLADVATDGSSLKWYDSSNQELSPTSLLSYGTYFATQVSGNCESTDRTTVVFEAGEPEIPSIITPQFFCVGATLSKIIVLNDKILWYTEMTGGTLLDGSTLLSNGVTYYASQKAGGCESERKAVSIFIGSSEPPKGLGVQVFCSSSKVSDLEVTGSAIQWYSSGVPQSLTATLNSGIYAATQGMGECHKDSLFVEVTILEAGLSAPRATTPQIFCESSVVSMLQANGSNIKWYNSLSDGTPLPAGTQLKDGSIYYASQSTELCESSNRTPVQVKIEKDHVRDPSSLEIASYQILCEPAFISDIAVNASGEIKWYDSKGNELASNTLLEDGLVYFAELSIGACRQPQVSVTIELKSVATISAPVFDNDHQHFCPGSVLANVLVPNDQIVWYASNGSGDRTPLSPGMLLKEGDYMLYAVQKAGVCESNFRTPVKITVGQNVLPIPEAVGVQVVCKDNATIADLRATGIGVMWFDSKESPMTRDSKLTNGSTYYAIQSSGSCRSSEYAPVTVHVNPAVLITGEPVDQNLCPGDLAQVQFEVKATTTAGSLKYQWYRNDELQSALTTPQITLSPEAAKGNTYLVKVSNECYSQSSKYVSLYENLNLVVQKRNHTLVINNNPAINGGYTFESYVWYKDGKVIKQKTAGGDNKGGYYYAGVGAELDMNAKYYAEMWDKSGNMYRTCEFTPEQRYYGTVSVYPNPLLLSQRVYVDADLDDEELSNATIEIYSPTGSYIGKVGAERLTPVSLPEEKGVYILKFRTDEREENFKIIVK